MITRTKARGFPARPARIARRGAFASALAVALLLLPPETLAQGEFWSFQIGAARSDVSIGERDVTWGTDRAQLTYQNPTTGGFYIAFEVQRRDRLVDHVFIGAAYKRFGDWAINGRAGFTADPEFYFRYMAEGALSRRLAGGLVGTVAYRYVNFSSTEVRIVSPGATYYFAKGEVGGQVNLVRNQALDVNSSLLPASRTLVCRTSFSPFRGSRSRGAYLRRHFAGQ